ncbi:MAG: Hsp20/alpha crystallin family protein [Clostridia bacterium]|nr:Hsp20/alpha crystallin family protein [Clostridia bacterium]
MFGLTPFRSNYVSAYDPFKEMEEFERRFFGQRTPAMRTDIRETENAYILEADLPGFTREDVHAEIKNGYLTIRAEHKSETEDKKENYLRRERSYGSFSRTFDLEGIDADAITASFKDGVLTLELPKLQPKTEEARRLEIQ